MITYLFIKNFKKYNFFLIYIFDNQHYKKIQYAKNINLI